MTIMAALIFFAIVITMSIVGVAISIPIAIGIVLIILANTFGKSIGVGIAPVFWSVYTAITAIHCSILIAANVFLEKANRTEISQLVGNYVIVSIIAICGVVFKMIWFNCPRWISTSVYIGMGWISVFIIIPLYKSIALGGVQLLLAGGILYTIGAVIYGLKPKYLKFKNLGYHEIFHIFILLGSLCHFIAVYKYVI